MPMSPTKEPNHPQSLPPRAISFSSPAAPSVFADTFQPRDQTATRLRNVNSESAEHAALTRLAYDLSLSLPIVSAPLTCVWCSILAD